MHLVDRYPYRNACEFPPVGRLPTSLGKRKVQIVGTEFIVVSDNGKEKAYLEWEMLLAPLQDVFSPKKSS